MAADPSHPILTAIALCAVAACVHDIGPQGVARTTSAILSNRAAVLQVAKARCRRLAECNRFGDGHMFADEDQCVTAYMDKGADVPVLRDCPYGVDASHLNACVATLVDQYCDARLVPVTAIPECGTYCAPLAAPAAARADSSSPGRF